MPSSGTPRRTGKAGCDVQVRRFHGRALYELNGLPEQVRNGPLLERVLQLLDSPWDAVPERPGQSLVRHAFFGEDDQGMLTFIVNE
jgi:hypothetical protein